MGHFFTNRIVNLWNEFPEEITTEESVNSFKQGLDDFWFTEEWLYEGGLYVKRKAGERLFFRKCRMENDQSFGCKIGEKGREPVKCKTKFHQNVEWKQGQKVTVKLENLVNCKVENTQWML